jgi:hypothetical protein
VASAVAGVSPAAEVGDALAATVATALAWAWWRAFLEARALGEADADAEAAVVGDALVPPPAEPLDDGWCVGVAVCVGLGDAETWALGLIPGGALDVLPCQEKAT